MVALSNWLKTDADRGNADPRSVNISVSLLRLDRAASLDFSLRLSEFLKNDNIALHFMPN